MKRFFLLIVMALVLFACGEDRGALLKVYNWGDYIDESILPEFEQWYEEQTGEKVSVIYQTFDVNETALSKIEKGHEDFDLVCPSDYIIERMLAKDLLLPIDRDFGETPNYIDENISPYIKKNFSLIEGNGKDANDYAVGYMWGTTGILYNGKYVTDQEASTWGILKNEKFAGKLFVKDAARDMYCVMLIHLRAKEIADSLISRRSLMYYDPSGTNIADVEESFNGVKNNIAGWDADFGKEQMVQERGYVNLSWSGDAVWAIEEAAEVGVDLRYSVPEEGSTVWFDGWVIPKYAQNVKAAKYFINFLCRPDITVRNVDVIGYVSASKAPEVLEANIDDSYDPINLTYFFGPEADSVRANPVMYPDSTVIARCDMEHDWGEHTEELISMWSRIKGDNASYTTVIVIAIVALILVSLILKRLFGKRGGRKHGARRR